jgi:hypothetical protein
MSQEQTPKNRREVIRTAAQVAVTAPAVFILLNATAKNAFAQIATYSRPTVPVNDATFSPGREEEPPPTNFTGLNGGSNQDDHV